MTQVRKRTPPATPRHAAACCTPLDACLKPALFKALSDPTRASLLACIAKCGRGCTVGEIADCCSVDLSVVSRHLALLARAGVVAPSKTGRVVTYTVRYADLSTALRQLANALDDCKPGKARAGGVRRGSCC